MDYTRRGTRRIVASGRRTWKEAGEAAGVTLAELSARGGLKELIDRLQREKIQVIQCTLTSVGERHDGTNQDDPNLDEFAAVGREVAKEKGLPPNDLREAFLVYWRKNNPANKPSGILTYDGHHFNDAGHAFVAEQMLKKFK